eukprot:7376951-Prymnesium_polylepis.2
MLAPSIAAPPSSVGEPVRRMAPLQASHTCVHTMWKPATVMAPMAMSRAYPTRSAVHQCDVALPATVSSSVTKSTALGGTSSAGVAAGTSGADEGASGAASVVGEVGGVAPVARRLGDAARRFVERAAGREGSTAAVAVAAA